MCVGALAVVALLLRGTLRFRLWQWCFPWRIWRTTRVQQRLSTESLLLRCYFRTKRRQLNISQFECVAGRAWYYLCQCYRFLRRVWRAEALWWSCAADIEIAWNRCAWDSIDVPGCTWDWDCASFRALLLTHAVSSVIVKAAWNFHLCALPLQWFWSGNRVASLEAQLLDSAQKNQNVGLFFAESHKSATKCMS